MEKCPSCSSTNLIYHLDTGEIICGDCGTVVQDVMMDDIPEYRALKRGEREFRSRVSTSLSVHDKGLSTSLSGIDRDAFGRKLPISRRIKMRRMKKLQIRSTVHSSMDRNIARAMTELDWLCDKVSATSSVKEEAALICRKALRKGVVPTRSIRVIVAASLYAAFRVKGVFTSLQEISKVSLEEERRIARCYRVLCQELNLRIPTVNPLIYIPKIAEKIGVQSNVEALATEILKDTIKNCPLEGKNPQGLAAAALYLACLLSGEERTQKEISKAAGISEATIGRNCRAIMRKNLLEPLHPLPQKWKMLINRE